MGSKHAFSQTYMESHLLQLQLFKFSKFVLWIASNQFHTFIEWLQNQSKLQFQIEIEYFAAKTLKSSFHYISELIIGRSIDLTLEL